MWETLHEWERFDYGAGEKDQESITLVLDLACQVFLGVFASALRVIRAPEARAV